MSVQYRIWSRAVARLAQVNHDYDGRLASDAEVDALVDKKCDAERAIIAEPARDVFDIYLRLDVLQHLAQDKYSNHSAEIVDGIERSVADLRRLLFHKV